MEKGSLHFLTDPFYLDKETNAPHYYSVGKKTQDMVLYAKLILKKKVV